MTAPCEVAMVGVEAVNAADAAPAGTVKVAGTLKRDGTLLERESGNTAGRRGIGESDRTRSGGVRGETGGGALKAGESDGSREGEHSRRG